MNRTPDNDRSNPIKRAFSKFLERGDVSKPKDPSRASPTVKKAETRAAPRVQAARPGTPNQRLGATGATATPASHSAASGTLAGGATRSTASSGAPRPSSPPSAAPTPVAGAAASTGASAAGAQRTYTVQKGDSLSKIAQQVYGRADRWHAIFNANRDKIADPDLIHPGQVLVLPDAPKLH
jgi:nucleoid-associated protein YgaU